MFAIARRIREASERTRLILEEKEKCGSSNNDSCAKKEGTAERETVPSESGAWAKKKVLRPT